MSQALAAIPLPVAIVAGASEGKRTCTTGTLAYVSFSPPLVATPLGEASRTLELLRASGEFSISILAEDQAELAIRAAQPSDGDRFAEQHIAVADPPDGFTTPGIAEASTVFWCRLESMTETADRVVCIGRVVSSRTFSAAPLLRFDHRYRALGSTVEVREETDYPL